MGNGKLISYWIQKQLQNTELQKSGCLKALLSEQKLTYSGEETMLRGKELYLLGFHLHEFTWEPDTFSTVLFLIAKNKKKLKCPSTGKQINKLW